jgi:hypothetical protein
MTMAMMMIMMMITFTQVGDLLSGMPASGTAQNPPALQNTNSIPASVFQQFSHLQHMFLTISPKTVTDVNLHHEGTTFFCGQRSYKCINYSYTKYIGKCSEYA